MPQIVMLTGAMGTGKSWLLENCCRGAVQVDVEKLQFEAVVAETGSEEGAWGWDVWDERMQQKAQALLGDAFDRAFPSLAATDGRSIVLAGSLLVRRWNREAWIAILAQRFPDHGPVTGVLLDFPADLVLGRIKQRGRPSEQQIDEEQIRKHLDGYRSIADQFWEAMTTSEQAANRLRELVE